MKALWFLPLAFIAGEHGFAFFAPYLVVFGTTVAVIKWRQHRPVPVPAPVDAVAMPVPA